MNVKTMHGCTTFRRAYLLPSLLELVILLLARGADIHATNSDGNTPLHNPCSSGDLDVIRYLIDSGAKLSTITQDRIKKFDSIGFVWDSHASTWIKGFQDLKDFRAKHGHCNVPHNYPPDPNLATWVKCQRRQYKLYFSSKQSSGMTLDRMEALNKLGFSWKAREDCPSPSKPPSKVGKAWERRWTEWDLTDSPSSFLVDSEAFEF